MEQYEQLTHSQELSVDQAMSNIKVDQMKKEIEKLKETMKAMRVTFLNQFGWLQNNFFKCLTLKDTSYWFLISSDSCVQKMYVLNSSSSCEISGFNRWQ